MPSAISTRLTKAWRNIFKNRDPTGNYTYHIGPGSGDRPDRHRYRWGNERSIIASIYTKIALDVASIPVSHVKVNEDGDYEETVKSSLNECLTVSANKDQTGMALFQDIVESTFDEGVIGVVPVDYDDDTKLEPGQNIESLRTGKIVTWYPNDVTIRLYNDENGQTEDITLPKSMVAIIENPFFAIMNAHGSTLTRLVHKLNILDAVDEQSGSGKLDLIIQLPYPTKSTERQKLAEKRRQNIDDQLNGSKYGVAYIDATEKVTQLNRPVENNLMKQVEVLTETLYSQLGMTTSIFDGTATPEVMTNYFTRTVEVMLSVIVLEFRRKYLSKEARAQGHSIMYLRDPFKFASVKDLAELADKFGRNIIVTPNEFRRKALHMRPSKDPEADKLKNRNIAEAKEPQSQDRPPTMEKIKEQEADNQNGGTI